jgi:hypothetical protein
MTTMVFSMAYWKSTPLEGGSSKMRRLPARLLTPFVGLLFLWIAAASYADTVVEAAQFRVDRMGDDVTLSAQLRFELPAAVEDALLKGIPVYFAVEADLLRERWYWTDKKIASAARNMRLAYQPLTGQWRLNVATGAAPVGELVAANAPSQTFSSLAEALATVKQFARWRIAGLSDNDASSKYRVDFRFWLDTNQLPRPFQIGVIAQSDWTISTNLRAALPVEKTGER